ncbi:radical SAM family heme chaperone HemW [Aminivibrio sp.]
MFPSPPSGPFSVYIHLPFCLRKCPYCSFFSLPLEEEGRDRYIALLEGEMAAWKGTFAGGWADTVYFGGGTPSLLTPLQWKRLFDSLEGALPLGGAPEITVEANPESLTREHLSLWRERGVTRVSLGVQSFSDAELLWLERPHDGRRAEEALASIAEEGLSPSADLIFGLGGQTLRSWKYSLDRALSLGAEHLSLYQLSLERGSRWFSRPPEGRPDGYPLYRFAQWLLPRKGFAQYEIASFSLPGRQSRHNRAYWTNKPVLALGAGAWGYWGGRRCRNEDTLTGYERAVQEKGRACMEWLELSEDEAAREAAVLYLRTAEGIPFAEFSSRYGGEILREILAILRELVPGSCLEWRRESVALTPRGMRVGNSIWSLLI